MLKESIWEYIRQIGLDKFAYLTNKNKELFHRSSNTVVLYIRNEDIIYWISSKFHSSTTIRFEDPNLLPTIKKVILNYA